jgi:hypothetical protein
LAGEIRAAALEANALPFLEGLSAAGVLQILSPSFAGTKLNAAGLSKFEKLANGILPSGHEGGFLAFLYVLVEKLTVREKAEVIRAFELPPDEAALWKKLDAQAVKLEAAMKSARIHKPSQVWEVLHAAPYDEVLLVLYRSAARVAQDRIRAYFEKYLPLAQEVTDEEVAESGAKPGTPKFDKTKRAMITTRLNARPRKIEAVEPEALPAVASGGGRGRG